MKNNVTELVFIIDRSGSMSGFEADTIGGFNSTIEKQRELDGKVYVSTVLFDNASKVMHLYIIGHKYVEIATSLKIPIGTVKARINRARIILKEQLKDYLC